MKKYALVLCSKTGFGGAERRALRIYHKIAENNPNVHIIFQASKKVDTEKLMREMGIPVEKFHSIKYCYSRRRVFLECIFGNYDTLHFFDASLLWTGIITFACLFKKKTKTIETIAYVFAAEDALKGKWRVCSHLTWKLASYVDLLYPNCLEIVKRYRKKKPMGCTPGTFTDLELFIPKKKKKVFLFCAARLELYKGPQLLLESITSIADEIRKNGYTVLIAGKDYQENEIRGQIRRNGLSDFVKLVGYIQPQEYMPGIEVVYTLATEDIFNYPSQVVAEAAASGCCVIATKCKNDPETFLNDSFALFCENNPDSLANTILDYMSLSETAKQALQANARTHAEKYFNIQTSVDYFSGILEELTQ